MLRKTERFTINAIHQGGLSEKCGNVEYKMSNSMARSIIKNHKGPKKRPQEILCDYVNSQMGLKGNCVKVLIEL